MERISTPEAATKILRRGVEAGRWTPEHLDVPSNGYCHAVRQYEQGLKNPETSHQYSTCKIPPWNNLLRSGNEPPAPKTFDYDF